MKCSIRRMLSTVICAAMVFTSVPVSAFAAEEAVPEETAGEVIEEIADEEIISDEEPVDASYEDEITEEEILDEDISEDETWEAEDASDDIIAAEGDIEETELQIYSYEDFDDLTYFYYDYENDEYKAITAANINLPCETGIYVINSGEKKYSFSLECNGFGYSGYIEANSKNSSYQNVGNLFSSGVLNNLFIAELAVQNVTLDYCDGVSLYMSYDMESGEYSDPIEGGDAVSLMGGDCIYVTGSLDNGEVFSVTRSDSGDMTQLWGNAFTIPDDVDGVTLTFGIYRFPYADYTYSVVDKTGGAVGLYYDWNCADPIDPTGEYGGSYGFKDHNIYARINGDVPDDSYYVVKNSAGREVATLKYNSVESIWYDYLDISGDVLTIEKVKYPKTRLSISSDIQSLMHVYKDRACLQELSDGDLILAKEVNTLYFKLNDDCEFDEGYSIETKFIISPNRYSGYSFAYVDADEPVGYADLYFPSVESDVTLSVSLSSTYEKYPLIFESPEDERYDLSDKISVTKQVQVITEDSISAQTVELCSGDYVSRRDRINIMLTDRLSELNTYARITFRSVSTVPKYSADEIIRLTELYSGRDIYPGGNEIEKYIIIAEEVKNPCVSISDPDGIGSGFVLYDGDDNVISDGEYFPCASNIRISNTTGRFVRCRVEHEPTGSKYDKKLRQVYMMRPGQSRELWNISSDLSVEISYAQDYKVGIPALLASVADIYTSADPEVMLHDGDTVPLGSEIIVKLNESAPADKSYTVSYADEWYGADEENYYVKVSLDRLNTCCYIDTPLIDVVEAGDAFVYEIKCEEHDRAVFNIDTETESDINLSAQADYSISTDDDDSIALKDGDYITANKAIYVGYFGAPVDAAEHIEAVLTCVSKDGFSRYSVTKILKNNRCTFSNWLRKDEFGNSEEIKTVSVLLKKAANPSITIIDDAGYGDSVKFYTEKFNFETDDFETTYYHSGDRIVPGTTVYIENGTDSKIWYELSSESGGNYLGAYRCKSIDFGKKDITVTLKNVPKFNVSVDSSALPADISYRLLHDDEEEIINNMVEYNSSFYVAASNLNGRALRARLIRGDKEESRVLFDEDSVIRFYDIKSDVTLVLDTVQKKKLKVKGLNGAAVSVVMFDSYSENEYDVTLENNEAWVFPGVELMVTMDGDEIERSENLEEYHNVLRMKSLANGQETVVSKIDLETQDSVSYCEMPDCDMELSFDVVKAYRVYFDNYRTHENCVDINDYIYSWDDEEDDSIYVLEGTDISVRRWLFDKLAGGKYCTFNVVKKADSSVKLVDNLVVDPRTTDRKLFTMPAYPVYISASQGYYPRHMLTIDDSSVTAGNSVFVAEKDKNSLYDVRSGSGISETQELVAGARAVEDDKKMLVTLTKTGTNEVVTGAPGGTLIDAVRNVLFGMPDSDVTVRFMQKDAKGSGKKVIIKESVLAGTAVAYTAYGKTEYAIENGDKVEAGDKVEIKISDIPADSAVAISVVCPDENMVASGAGITNDFSKAYYSNVVKKAGKYSFTMPDYPVEVSVRELSAEDVEVMESDIKEAEVTLDETVFEFTGDEIEPDYTVVFDGSELKYGEDYTAEYSDNINAGTAKLCINGTGKYSGRKVVDFTITAKDITSDDVTVVMADRIPFTRVKEYEPEPIILLGDKQFAAEGSLRVEYSNNTTVTDSAIAKITGVGNFKGSMTRTFEIYQDAVDFAMADVTLEADSFEYTGHPIEPEFTVKYAGSTLDEGVDYTYSYSNNKDVGTGVITIAGLGVFDGKLTKTFTITKRSFDSGLFVATIANVKYSKRTHEYKPAPIVVYGDDKLIPDVDYSLSYSDNDGTKEDASVTITGINNFEGSRTLDFKILKETVASSKFSITLSSKKYTYDGTEKCPDVTVKYGGDPVDAEDYEVVYYDNIDAGYARVCIVGMGQFSGTKEIKYKIDPAQLSDTTAVIRDIPDQVYSGESRPEVVVINKSTDEAIAASDLKITYSNNKKTGTAKVTVKGKNNYRGTLKTTFTIGAMGFDDYDYSIEDQLYTGKKCTPNIIAIHRTTGEVITLSSKNAFKVKWADNTAVGTATATFEPKNSNTFVFDRSKDNKKVIEFNIVKTDLAMARIAPIADQKYRKNKETKPKISVYVGNTKISNRNLKIVYGSNTDKGIGTVTITSADPEHFTGTQTATFTIK